MAVPKKRTGKSAQGHRRSNWKATVPETTVCKTCGEIVLTHTVCSKCGSYKGKVVSIKADGYVAEEPAKKTKKTTKAAKTVSKAPAEEVKVEETQAEVIEEVKAEEVEVKEEEKTEE